MPPSMHAPRRKSCQALLTDGETPCSRTFRGWGRYCSEHLEECAKLSGQYKDASARTERLRRHGELSERQVRGLTTTPAAQRAVEKAQQYLAAIEEEMRTRTVHFTRFPAEKDERHQQRLAVLEERKAACATLITQLQQHCDATGQRRQGDLERQPLLGTTPRLRGCITRTVWIAFFVVLPLPLIYWFIVFSRIEPKNSSVLH